MAFVLGKGFMEMDLDDGALNKKMGRVNKRFKKFEAGLNKFVKRAAIIGGAAVAAIGAWAVKVAAEQERAENMLKAALDKANEGTEENIKLLHKQAAAIQKVTTFGDEEILMHMATARNMGIVASKLNEVTRAAIGLAKTYNTDLKTAMLLITRANMGQTQMLTRYGIVLDENATKEEKFQQLLKIGAGGFRLATAETDTFAGKLKQLKNVIGDAGEKLGGPMLDSLTSFAEAARDFIEQADFAAWGAGVADALKAAMEAITAWRRFVARGKAAEELPGTQTMFGPATEAQRRAMAQSAATTRAMRARGVQGWGVEQTRKVSLDFGEWWKAFRGEPSLSMAAGGGAMAGVGGRSSKEAIEANQLRKKQLDALKVIHDDLEFLHGIGVYQ